MLVCFAQFIFLFQIASSSFVLASDELSSLRLLEKRQTQRKVVCEALNSNMGLNRQQEAHIHNYNCSFKGLDWPLSQNLFDHAFSSESLDLSFNRFDQARHTIYDESFAPFILLTDKLNLSSNQFKHIEKHAFYVSKAHKRQMQFKVLDLSNNSFDMVPYEALKNLYNLETLIMNMNPIKYFDFNGLDERKVDDEHLSNYFQSLVNLYLSSCQIEFVHANILKLFSQLQLLDLSSNNIKTLSLNANLPSTSLIALNLNNNPLKCDCNLLWLKRFIETKKSTVNSYPTCFINKKIHNESLVIETIQIDKTDSNRISTKLNRAELGPQFYSSTNTNYQLVSMQDLIDEDFICDMNLYGQINFIDFNTIELKCIVKSYPKAMIRWTYGKKSLQKSANDEQTYKTWENSTHMDDSILLESKLIIPYQDVYDQEFFCRTNHHFSLNQKHLAQPEYLQKLIQFDVISWYQPKKGQLIDETTSSYGEFLRKKDPLALVYWIIISLCLFFSLMSVLLVAFCLLKRIRQTKKDKDYIYYTAPPTNPANTSEYYNSFNSRKKARFSYYGDTMSNPSQPLKPDVIREHHESNSIYVNLNRSPSKCSTPYINHLFASPYSNHRKMLRSQEPKYSRANRNSKLINNANVSFDENPIENSLIYELNSSTSMSTETKSFDENIEEYLDPKFDDLNKPSARNSASFKPAKQNVDAK